MHSVQLGKQKSISKVQRNGKVKLKNAQVVCSKPHSTFKRQDVVHQTSIVCDKVGNVFLMSSL